MERPRDAPDRFKPPRRHRSVVPNDDLSPSEKRAAASALAGASVAHALLGNQHFRKAVDKHDPEEVASMYTVRASAGRAALVRLVELCHRVPADAVNEHTDSRFRSASRFPYVAALLSGWTAHSDAPVPSQSRIRLGEIKLGTVALLRIGEGRCTACGGRRTTAGGDRLLCDSHTHGLPESVRQSARRRARREVDSALAALAVVVERESTAVTGEPRAFGVSAMVTRSVHGPLAVHGPLTAEARAMLDQAEQALERQALGP